jgi:hypothetical protein
MQQEVRKYEVDWAQADLAVAAKISAEKKLAAILQDIHDRIGKEEWLAQVKARYGWGQAAAYRHKDPDGMAKDRERAAQRRAEGIEKILDNLESEPGKEVEQEEEIEEEIPEEMRAAVSREEKTVRKNCPIIIGALLGNIESLGVEKARSMFHDEDHKGYLKLLRKLHGYLTIILKGELS